MIATPAVPKALERRVLFVLAMALLPHVLNMPPWISLLAGAGLLWRELQLRGTVPSLSKTMLVALLAGGIAANWATHGSLIGREGGVSFLMLLTGLKVLEMRDRRDVGVSLLLGLFLLLTLFLFDQGPLTALWALIAFVLMLALLSDLASFDEPRPLPERMRQFAPTLAATLPIALLLFVLAPRPSAPLLGLPQQDQATTGLSDELAPGSITDLSRSAEVAFRATFHGEEPTREELYWRGPVFWLYDGRRWQRQPEQTSAGERDITPGLRELDYELMLEPQPNGILPALDRPIGTPPGARMLPDQELRLHQPAVGRMLVRLQSSPDALLDPDAPQRLLRLGMRLPPNANPELTDLGKTWRTLPPRTRIEAALKLFREQDFRYTLQPPALPERDGMDAFLFDTRAGFCEHYATSFVLLMRAAGLPARVVTGYQGGEKHPDGYWIVRQGDAHAWAEVWLTHEGWVRIDPTQAIAPERIDQGLSAAVPRESGTLPAALRRDFGFLHRIRLHIDGMENRWNRWVLGYDLNDQRALLAALGINGPPRPVLWGLTLSTLLAALLAAAVWRRRAARTMPEPHLRLWRALEASLSDTPWQRYPDEAPRAWMRRLSRADDTSARTAASFIEVYLDWRYGPPHQPGGQAPARILEERLRQLKRRRA
ncbi:MAG: transglutaminaseTgpA domain-containing protein [Pseudomonadota bacterium]